MTGCYEHRIRHQRDDVKDRRRDRTVLECCREATEQTVREKPVIVTLAAFGLGLGLGAIVGSLLAEPQSSSSRLNTSSVGRRALESFSEFLPASVSRRFRS